MPNRVGMLYALLGVVLSKQGELATNAQGGDPWFSIVQSAGILAYMQDPDPSHWHLPDDAFDAASLARQASAEDWAPGQQIRVSTAADRRQSLLAVGGIGLHAGRPAPRTNDPRGSEVR